ncbi:MAG: glutathione S-transferase family protein [Deltaproteobacteria bacterium]|nr:glutathione S-transferase family protein [Deltaproteobacteria bacterium]
MSLSLTYFDFDGSRGLECRLALTLAGVPFDDVRVTRDQWAALRAHVPFGALPVLADGDRTIAQSVAILGYVGRAHGLHPADPWTAAEHDALMLSVEDARSKMPEGKGMAEADKKAAREAFAAGWLRQWARTVEARIRGPFVQGDRPQVVDVKLYVILRSYLSGTFDYIGADTFADCPKLLGLHAAMQAHPAVQGYWASRTQG